MRGIEMEGLLWGGSKFADVAYGVRKLVINAGTISIFFVLHSDPANFIFFVCHNSVVHDDLVSVDEMQEKMEALELVQSTEIVVCSCLVDW